MKLYQVLLVVDVRSDSEYGACLTVKNWLNEQQRHAPDVSTFHDINLHGNCLKRLGSGPT